LFVKKAKKTKKKHKTKSNCMHQPQERKKEEQTIKNGFGEN
jgi:hypothetical protein